MSRMVAIIFVALFIVLAAACAPQAAPVPQASALAPAAALAPASGALSSPAPQTATKPAWQERWEQIQAAAKKEGRVAIHTGGGPTIRTALVQIAQMQGLNAEVVSTRTEEFMARALAERRAGLYLHDIWFSSTSGMLPEGKETGMLQPIEPALLLPDLTDPALIKKTWFKGELPWVDKDRTVLATTITAQSPIVINTNLVKEGEIKSWRDVLNPKWKGKIIVNDPTVSGAGQLGLSAIDGIMGWDYVKELSKMDITIVRDQRLQLDWLAQGKVAILLPPKPDALRDYLKLGAPIRAIVPAEGTWVSTGSSALSFMSREPHPNAAKVFINWLLSKEAQTLFSQGVGFQSARDDVPTAHLRPEDIRQETVKYYIGYSEEASAGPRRLEVNKQLRDLFGALIKK